MEESKSFSQSIQSDGEETSEYSSETSEQILSLNTVHSDFLFSIYLCILGKKSSAYSTKIKFYTIQQDIREAQNLFDIIKLSIDDIPLQTNIPYRIEILKFLTLARNHIKFAEFSAMYANKYFPKNIHKSFLFADIAKRDVKWAEKFTMLAFDIFVEYKKFSSTSEESSTE